MSFANQNLEDIPLRDKISLFAHDQRGPTTWELHSSLSVPANLQACRDGQVFGDDPPEWMRGPMKYDVRALYATRFDEAFFSPEWGVVFPERAVVFAASAAAARYKSPDLSQVPGFNDGQNSFDFSIEKNDLDYLNGTFLILNHWGSKNFGHYIFDSLPGVFVFLSEIVRGELKLLTPPLRDWQRSFLDRMGISRSAIQEVDVEICRCERIIFPGSLCDNLNFPSPVTQAMLEYLKVSGEGQDRTNAPRRIYVSRSKYDSRQMLNEADLIEALLEFDFVRVCPEEYSINQQINVFSEAEIIVGEIGAALSNIAFARGNCHVIEIMPELKPSVWIKNLCSMLRFRWTCVYSEVPLDLRTISIVDGVEYNNLVFSYNVSVVDVVAAVKSGISGV